MVDNLVFVLSSNRPNVKLAGAESSESLSETILADCPAAEAARTARPLVAPHALINAYVWRQTYEGRGHGLRARSFEAA